MILLFYMHKGGCNKVMPCNQAKFELISRIRLTYVLAAFLAFIYGTTIYAFFRDLNIVLFQFIPKPSFLASLRIPLKTETIWGYLFTFNLPHGLWCLSGLLVIRAIWLTNIKWRAIYGVIFIVAISSLEISQLNEKRFGTFDVLDLVFYGASTLVESVIFNMFVKRKERKR